MNFYNLNISTAFLKGFYVQKCYIYLCTLQEIATWSSYAFNGIVTSCLILKKGMYAGRKFQKNSIVSACSYHKSLHLDSKLPY